MEFAVVKVHKVSNCKKEVNKRKDKPDKQIVSIIKDFKAHIAHFVPTQSLPNNCEKCKCRNIHGHTVTIRVMVKGYPDEKTRMVMDFTELKDTFGMFIDEFIDHLLVLPIHMISKIEQFEHIDRFFSDFYVTKSNDTTNGCILLFTEQDGFISVPIRYSDIKSLEVDEYIIAVKIGPFSFLNVPSTTAVDMAVFFTDVLKKFVKERKNIVKVGVRFFETDTSSAVHIDSV